MHGKQALLLTRNLRMIEESYDGHRIVNELEMGNILNIILTSDAKAKIASKKDLQNVPLEAVLAFSVIYTDNISEKENN